MAKKYSLDDAPAPGYTSDDVARVIADAREQLLRVLAAPSTENDIRAALLVRRTDKLNADYMRLKLIENDFMAMLAAPIDWYNIKPELHWVERGSQDELMWYYARSICSSAPNDSILGRRITAYIVDSNSGRWLGIIRMTSPMNVISPREQYVGWHGALKWRNLNRVINLQCCVAIQPFGVLCGGKLLAMLATSNEARAYYQTHYPNAEPLIAIETTSLFGKSSQYNRLPEWKYLGLTKGSTNMHVDDNAYRAFLDYFKVFPAHNTSGNHASKMRAVVHIGRRLGIKSLEGDTSYAGHKRGVYWCNLAENTLDILNERTTTVPLYYDKPMVNIVQSFMARWHDMRLPKYIDQALGFDNDSYSMDRNMR
jgi:hypothetical protein